VSPMAETHFSEENRVSPSRLDAIQHAMDHATHLLPSQGPIRIFIHHNTLHAFEEEPFDIAVAHAQDLYGCNPYLSESEFHQKLATGRILSRDLVSVLLEDLGAEADHSIGNLCTRFQLRLAMLQYPLRMGTDTELRWLIAETDALSRFREERPTGVKEQMVEETQRWVMRDLRADGSQPQHGLQAAAATLIRRFGEADIESWSSARWESLTLHLLWHICHTGVHGAPRFTPPMLPPVRCREPLRELTGVDTDRLINDQMIIFCPAFLDQGISHWTLPNRDLGFFRSFLELFRNSRPVDSWLANLPKLLDEIDRAGWSPLEIIDHSLQELGVPENQIEAYVTRTLLALPGWAGMLWQMETNAEWTVHPAPRGTLMEYLAVRLLLERLAISHTAQSVFHDHGELRTLRGRLLSQLNHAPRVSVEQRAFLIFQLAQSLGWKPEELHHLSKSEWSRLIEEVESFSELERRRIYQQAFERRYRNQTLDALILHGRRSKMRGRTPRIQVSCCLDDREESYRRHLEEVAPDCETFGAAGFYGVAMYYRGAADAHYTPLCPVVVKPNHYVREEVVYSFENSSRRREETRRAIGKTRHWLHTGSRSILGGAMTALLGTLASFPLVMQVLFPRLTSRAQRLFGSFIKPPMITRLLIEREEASPGPEPGHQGYTVDEMVAIGSRVLTDMGLTRNFARLVILTGHGSWCLNNPHESAYDCGACGGGRGGPNARAIAAILNDPRIRERLEKQGLVIPRKTVFIGTYHNTCDDSVTFFDLDRLPSSHHEDFEYARNVINEARRRNAHERCRRFVSAELSLSEEAALRHVEARSEDISQVRPECGHATNAVGFVGRRSRTRGLFMDRRTLLTSYDPAIDTPDAVILERILQAVIPVCAGINLEYYFSFVDPIGYGCGSKLPQNISALLGVMDGAASDLRPGLPWQMVEIHEPLRILFVIETTPEAMTAILERNPKMKILVDNGWIQLALLDPTAPEIKVFRNGGYEHYEPEATELPVVKRSRDWYRGWRDHLGYASILSQESDHVETDHVEQQEKALV